MRLREKYPKAFRRRSSICSDTASVSSDAGPAKANTMTPMPKGHVNQAFPSSEIAKHPQRTSYGGAVGLPPQHPLVASVQRPQIPNKFSDQASVVTHIDDVTRHLHHDLTITGTSTGSLSPGRHRNENTMTINDRKMAGILKKDLEMFNTSMISESSFVSQGTENSHLSLKERLHKNQMTLKALLSEENNPLKKQKPWKSKRTAAHNKTFETDISLDNELSISIDTPDNQGAKRGNCDELLLMPRLSTQAETSSIAKDSLEQKRSLADLPQRKHLGTKRYVSPDSSHDSAVDMDTASLQSSPGSSDTQTTVNTCRPSRTKSGIRLHQNGSGTVSQNSGYVNTDFELSPRERITISRSHPDYLLAHPKGNSKQFIYMV